MSVLAGVVLAVALGVAADPASAAYTARLKAGTLTVTGNAASDKLALRLAPGAPMTLQLDVGADGTADFSFNRNAFTSIEVDAGRGDDQVIVDQSAGSFPDEATAINGGAGADVLRGGSGAETLRGGDGADVVAGGDGNDRAFLGDGDDRFEWNPGDDSDTVEGQLGSDLLDFNGSNASESVDVSADGGRVRFVRDVAGVTTDLGGVERIAFDALAGTDTIAVNDLAGTPVNTVDVDLSAFAGGPDAQVDTVVARGTGAADHATVGGSDGRVVIAGLAAQTRIAGGEAHDELTLATLGDADEISAGAGIPGVAPVNVDGGEGSDTLRYNGTAAGDELGVFANGSEVTTLASAASRIDTSAVERELVLGHGGADTITAIGNLAALVELALDGGEDNDVLRGGNGADYLDGGGGNDALDGNQGSDHLLAGDGDDRLQWDPGDGSDATVDGQAGHDLLDFNGSSANEHIALGGYAGRAQLSRDVGAIVLNLAALEHLAVHAFGGTDVIQVVPGIDETPLVTFDADLGAFGGGGDGLADIVYVHGTHEADSRSIGASAGMLAIGGLGAEIRVAGSEAHDDVTVGTHDGADTIDAAIGVPGPVAVNVDGGYGADVLRYNGSPGADEIPVFANGGEVSVAEAASARIDARAGTVESLVVLGHGGSDQLSAVGNLAALIALTLDGGEDNDRLFGGNGSDLVLGGGGNDALDGNQGADRLLGGDGDDRFQWDPGDGSDHAVDGEAGSDLLDFNGSGANETIAVAANGELARLTRDVAAIALELAHLEHLAVHSFGGTDSIDVGNLAGTSVGIVDADIAAFDGSGDALIDTVVVRGTDGADSASVGESVGSVAFGGLAAQVRVTGGEAHDEVTLSTLGGEDTISTGIGIPGVVPVNVNGGDAADVVRYDGTAGGDEIGVFANGTEVTTIGAGGSRIDTTAVESLVALGHAGPDSMSATGNIAALVALTFDGGEDGDVLRGGNGPDRILGGAGADALDGNQGADHLLGGEGHDRFQWDPGDGSDATVDGEAGSDLVDFFGSSANEQIRVAANGQLTRLTRDVAAITLDFANLEHLAVHALGGTDTIDLGNLAGTPTATVDAGLGAFDGGGDGQADSVVVNGTDAADVVAVTRSGTEVSAAGLAALVRVAGSESANDALRVQTLGGDDDVTVAPDVSELIAPIVDLGPDE